MLLQVEFPRAQRLVYTFRNDKAQIFERRLPLKGFRSFMPVEKVFMAEM
jgi:hypothetical protein